MKLTLFVNDKDPKVAAQLLAAKARLKLEGRVYVRAHTRIGPRAWFKTGAEYDERREELAVAKEKGISR
jgi:hypothetical protein